MTTRHKRRVKELETNFEIKSNTNEKSLNNIIKNIKNEYMTDLKHYYYLNDTALLIKGSHIKYVTLDLKTIHTGVVVNVLDNVYGTPHLAMLRNISASTYWKIRLNNYYIFVLNKQEKKMDKLDSKDKLRSCLLSYCKTNNIEI